MRQQPSVQHSACDQSGDEQQPPVRRVVPGPSSILSPHRGFRSAVPDQGSAARVRDRARVRVRARVRARARARARVRARVRVRVRARVRVRVVELVLPVQLLDALARGGEESVEQVLHLVRVRVRDRVRVRANPS